MYLLSHFFREPALKVGMKTPTEEELDDYDNFDSNQFPHLTVLNICLKNPKVKTKQAVLDNAKIIVIIPDSKIRVITKIELQKLGCSWD